VALGQKGGKARLLKITPERRSEIARKAVLARWAKHKKKNATKTNLDCLRLRLCLKKELETITGCEGRSVTQVCKAFLRGGSETYKKKGSRLLQRYLAQSLPGPLAEARNKKTISESASSYSKQESDKFFDHASNVALPPNHRSWRERLFSFVHMLFRPPSL
jgi:hypothetical protein